ncbi:DNA primase/helicase [Microbacterium phage Pumpernickel]|uniref:DNA primase/helicase n=1 Tax=Microbacterium phage Pumpernickel TaxID=2885983 RepID=A0AAE8Y7N0_9CAUD|nr:DNA primase/helicase [Microbacterium phage Pumpernickel]UDL15892.1 DNA primase/helicase [Microbacterium phage Pumpernickel]
MTETNPLQNGALWYAQNLNWQLLPCHGIRVDGKCTCGQAHTELKDIGKHPASRNGLTDATTDPSTLAGWWDANPRYNIGVMARNSGFFVIDIDPRNGGDDSFAKLEELLDYQIPKTLTAYTGAYPMPGGKVARGRHLFFRAPEGVTFKGNLKAEGLPGIDIKYNGYVLLYPSNHITGVQYEWDPNLAPWTPGMEMADPSPEMLEALTKKTKKFGNFTANPADFWASLDGMDYEGGGEKMDLEKLLEEEIHEGGRAVEVHRIACALANELGTNGVQRDAVITRMIRFNAEKVVPPLEMDELMQHVNNAINFVAENPKPDMSRQGAFGQKIGEYTKNMGARVVLNETPNEDEPDLDYDEYSDDDDPETYAPMVPMSMDPDALDDDAGGEPGSRTMTDTGNGRRFVDANGQLIRYTPGLGFFVWKGQYWNPDTEQLNVREMAKELAPMIGAEAARLDDKEQAKEAYKWAKDSKSNARQKAAIESAQSDPRIGVPVEYWDKDPHLLGVANGVLNLKTGELFRGRADLHITKRAPVAYQPGFANLPRFQEFLDYATYGDKEFQAWLQRAIGYTLTGLRTYDVMFLMYGPPGSGKNVLVEAIVKLLGTKEYALPLPSELLGSGDGKSNQADQYYWAEMRGKRMLWVDELPESERLKENAVKKLTGSSTIQARSPGEKPFSFDSQAKLWITTNHQPIITDDAMWRRIRPIPWTHTPSTPDPTLKQYLHDPEGGLPAILAWAVEGAKIVLNSTEPDALGWCARVRDAAEVYQKNEDRLGMFLEEEMEQDVLASITVRAMYAPYRAWSEDRGERSMTQIAFTRKLRDKGIEISGSGNNAQVLGYRAKSVNYSVVPPTNTQPAPGGHNWLGMMGGGVS